MSCDGPSRDQGGGPPPRSTFPAGHLLARLAWDIVRATLFRPSPALLHGWRRALLRLFGARIGRGALVYPTTRIWAPWNLEMADRSTLGPYVDCYCVGRVRIGQDAVISQYAFLCAAGRDYEREDLPLEIGPIEIGPKAWIGADVFIGPGVTVGEGAVAGARSSVFRDVEPWTVVVGTPARFLKKRILRPPAG